ncbi:unnamed protein product [Toxocara canis]|uniref:Protein LTV1 homolog n=1 Tax=Toxocara canis TaxID=6265 RepID=A0A183UW54_TOXCA|nr:unnamed protein product [Toxocara canis]
MPKNKKKWIDNKNAETFRLVHRSQKDPLIADDTVGERVLQPIEKKNVEEHIKYGIYYDDDYNYLQHLRSVNEVSEFEAGERTIIRAPKGKANLPSTLFETGGVELNVGLLNQAASPGDMPELDEDIVAALEGDIEYTDELEDDFVLKANGGELPSSRPPEPVTVVSRSKPARDSESESYEGNSYFDSDTQEDSDEDKEMCGEMACNSAHSRIIDEQFERLCNDGELSEDEEEMAENLLEPDSHRMKELVDEYKRSTENPVLENDEIARRYAFASDSEGECESLDRISVECPTLKKAKWDCESVLSSYSNIYNRPTVIKEPTRRRLGNRNTGINAEQKQSVEAMDCESESAVNGIVGSTRRRREETADEKRERKKAVKEARAERRAEKKANKRAFAETRHKFVSQAADRSIRVVHIA